MTSRPVTDGLRVPSSLRLGSALTWPRVSAAVTEYWPAGERVTASALIVPSSWAT